jgi:hypothetical protein
LAWHRLPSEQKVRATVKVIGGPVYTAHQIDRLHYGAEAGRLAGLHEPLVQLQREKADVGAAPSRVLDRRALVAAARASHTLLDRCSDLSGYLRANRSAVATR